MGALVGWGLLDRRLSRATRIMLLLLRRWPTWRCWGRTSVWAHRTGIGVRRRGAPQRQRPDVSSSRFGSGRTRSPLIAQHPWLGVGFGEFNFAWTLTPFPDRPVAFFDHAHNLMLQFARRAGHAAGPAGARADGLRALAGDAQRGRRRPRAGARPPLQAGGRPERAPTSPAAADAARRLRDGA